MFFDLKPNRSNWIEVRSCSVHFPKWINYAEEYRNDFANGLDSNAFDMLKPDSPQWNEWLEAICVDTEKEGRGREGRDNVSFTLPAEFQLTNAHFNHI